MDLENLMAAIVLEGFYQLMREKRALVLTREKFLTATRILLREQQHRSRHFGSRMV